MAEMREVGILALAPRRLGHDVRIGAALDDFQDPPTRIPPESAPSNPAASPFA